MELGFGLLYRLPPSDAPRLCGYSQGQAYFSVYIISA